ncbi:hypothetical protein JL720_15253 [Aureococcus anophagefferens]|nr:hypothetical protein JL720_15253 [Aureococcus anophagefferens]
MLGLEDTLFEKEHPGGQTSAICIGFLDGDTDKLTFAPSVDSTTAYKANDRLVLVTRDVPPPEAPRAARSPFRRRSDTKDSGDARGDTKDSGDGEMNEPEWMVKKREYEQRMARIRRHVDNDVPEAIKTLGDYYFFGHMGLVKSAKKARLWKRGVELERGLNVA